MFDNLVVYLNNKCNLRCKYCYVKKNNNVLSFVDFKKIYTFFLLHYAPSDQGVVSFLGGEPLLDKVLLKQCIRYIRKYPLTPSSFTIWVSTNGIFLTPSILKFFKEYKVNVSISLDGTSVMHDSNRVFPKSNIGSFKKIMHNLKKIPLSQKGAIGVTSIISPEYSSSLIDIFSFIRKLGFVNFDFYPIFQYNWWNKKDISSFEQAMKKLTKHYCDLFNNNKVDEVFLLQVLHTLIKTGQFWDYNKMEKCQKLFVDPKGDFYPCEIILGMSAEQKKNWRIGNLNTGVDILLRKKILKMAGDYLKSTFPNLKLEAPCFCPFSFYFWAKSNRKDCKKALSFCLKFSEIYRKNFVKIVTDLRDNPLFKERYGIS